LEDLEMMTLFDGWTEEHAKALLDSLKLNGGVPHWKPECLKKLQEWCADHGKDHKSVEGQLDFVAFELRNAHQDIGAGPSASHDSRRSKEGSRALRDSIARRAGMAPGIYAPQREAALSL
jgi:hypothetical protein